MRQLSSIITMSALEVHKSRGRRDVVSEAEILCELCTTVKGRVRDIRKHLREKHNLESFFKCMDSECDFVCSINFSCFTMHAIRCHGEYFQGRGTNLEKHRLFKLLTVNAKRKQNKHSQMCVDESEIENFKKRREIRRRSAAEARVLKKFSKITDSVRLNVK